MNWFSGIIWILAIIGWIFVIRAIDNTHKHIDRIKADRKKHWWDK
jgi:hypothetical protein